MLGSANDLENEWTTCVSTQDRGIFQDGSIFYQNELNADPENAVDEDLLEDDLGDQNLSVIEEEMRASQFGKAGPNGTAAAPGGVSYQAMVH